MPEPKAQLVDPQGPIDVPGISATGIVTATGGFIGAVQGAATGFAATTYNISAGVVTSTGFVGDVTGTASSVTKGTDLYVGVMTASSFSGDVFGNAAGLSTTTAGLKLGIVTSTTFAGDFTGMGSGITGTPNIQAGIMTATSFVGDFTGIASGITGAPNMMVGILTGTSYNGDGSNLTGIAATNWITNNVTANSSTTTVDLSDGNVVKFTQSANTTVSFANTGTSNIVTFLRLKDATSTPRTLTWPDSIKWDGGSAPTLVDNNAGSGTEYNLITLLTRDEGVTWYGWETAKRNEVEGLMYGWGSSTYGRLGMNQPQATKYSSPVQMPGSTWSKALVAPQGGGSVKTDGTLWVWGQNAYGMLAQNNTVSNYSSPVQVPGTTWNKVRMSYLTSWATKTDGTLWAWGGNSSGELAQNDRTFRSSPVQIPGTWANYEIHKYGVYALKTNGELWVWGENGSGQLGQNNHTKYSSPVQIPGTYKTTTGGIAALNDTGAFIKTSGELYVVGGNYWCENAKNDPFNRYHDKSSPIQVPGTTWSSIHGMNRGAWFAFKTDGTHWVWGKNDMGQLGLNTTSGWPNETNGSPIQIPGTGWVAGQVGSSSYCGSFALKDDGTLWSWGDNEQGALGHNNETQYSSPTQIGSLTDWSSFGLCNTSQDGPRHTFGIRAV